MSIHPRSRRERGASSDMRQGSLRVLAICEPVETPDAEGDGATLPFPDLTEETLNLLDPHVVITPLMSQSFDCMDVATCLASADFGGQVRVVAPWVPQPSLIAEELRRLYPTLTIEIWVQDPP